MTDKIGGAYNPNWAGDDANLHEEYETRFPDGHEISAGPVKKIKKTGRVVLVAPGSRPPPRVRQVSVVSQGLFYAVQGAMLINLGSFMFTLYVPAAGTGQNANQTLQILGPFDFDIEISEFTINTPGNVAYAGNVWLLCVIGPED